MPILRLGGVNLPRSCEEAIKTRQHKCHTDYVNSVKEVYVQAKCYDGAESVKKAMCCSLWEAKDCLVQASSELVECGENITELYRALPSDKEIRAHVLDQCSEYDEMAATCVVVEPANFSFGGFVTILVLFISLPAIAYGGMKAYEFYQDYK